MLYAGTSGWAYPTWKPAFYPEKLAQKDFLRYYASQVNAVEVNYTFRHMLSEKTITKWLAETPPEFRFVIKAHQNITHIKRLKGAEEPLRRFISSISLLESSARLGPVLFQLPPNLKANADLLRVFLALLPKLLRCSFEFRHVSWFAPEIYDVLSERNAALCVAEDDDLATPDVTTASFSYYRLRKTSYSPDERSMIGTRLSELAGNREVFAFFKHEDTPEGALYARELLQAADSLRS
ncbi:MAG TPA: DUF72 domain-containing protein [Terriglobales bacterium]|nr:DUF72 domain-containing protein [Terriglobales bacterium]